MQLSYRWNIHEDICDHSSRTSSPRSGTWTTIPGIFLDNRTNILRFWKIRKLEYKYGYFFAPLQNLSTLAAFSFFLTAPDRANFIYWWWSSLNRWRYPVASVIMIENSSNPSQLVRIYHHLMCNCSSTSSTRESHNLRHSRYLNVRRTKNAEERLRWCWFERGKEESSLPWSTTQSKEQMSWPLSLSRYPLMLVMGRPSVWSTSPVSNTFST